MAEQFNVEQAQEVLNSGLEQAQEIMADPSKLGDLLNQLQETLKQLPAEAGGALSKIPLMIEMVKGYITRQYTEVSPKVIALIVSAFIYIVKQKDFIADPLEHPPLNGLCAVRKVIVLLIGPQSDNISLGERLICRRLFQGQNSNSRHDNGDQQKCCRAYIFLLSFYLHYFLSSLRIPHPASSAQRIAMILTKGCMTV